MMPDEFPTTLEERIMARLARSPATFTELWAGLAANDTVYFRKLDGALQRLRRAGQIVSLPRVKGKRPTAQWALAGGSTALSVRRDTEDQKA